MNNETANNNILITGIGRGIGKALAQQFLEKGWKVFGTTTDGKTDIEHEGLSVLKLELEKDEDIRNLTASLSASGTKLDILVNNAGALFDKDETKVVVDKLRRTLEVNLLGTIALTEAVLPFMNESSHIVNISSTAGSLGEMDDIANSHSPYHYPAYKISKCALNMYTRTLAARMHHEGQNVLVSSVHPGWVKTDIGGSEAPFTPEDAAKSIFGVAVSRPETGQFWFGTDKLPW